MLSSDFAKPETFEYPRRALGEKRHLSSFKLDVTLVAFSQFSLRKSASQPDYQDLFPANSSKKEGDERSELLASFVAFDRFTVRLLSYPTDPSISRSISLLSSTLYSMGNSLMRSFTKPFTHKLMASASFIPRCCM